MEISQIIVWCLIIIQAYILGRYNRPKKKECNHPSYDLDTQIRTLKCTKCGHKSWLNKQRDLYINGKFEK